MKQKWPNPVPATSIPLFPSRFPTVCQPTSFTRKAISWLIPCLTRPSSPAERFGRITRNLPNRNQRGIRHYESTTCAPDPGLGGSLCYHHLLCAGILQRGFTLRGQI